MVLGLEVVVARGYHHLQMVEAEEEGSPEEWEGKGLEWMVGMAEVLL